MNPVVQQILDSGADEDVDKEIDGGTRVIDLTDEEKAQNNLATTQVLNLAKIPVDTTCCKDSVKIQHAAICCPSKSRKRAKFLYAVAGF